MIIYHLNKGVKIRYNLPLRLTNELMKPMNYEPLVLIKKKLAPKENFAFYTLFYN